MSITFFLKFPSFVLTENPEMGKPMDQNGLALSQWKFQEGIVGSPTPAHKYHVAHKTYIEDSPPSSLQCLNVFLKFNVVGKRAVKCQTSTTLNFNTRYIGPFNHFLGMYGWSIFMTWFRHLKIFNDLFEYSWHTELYFFLNSSILHCLSIMCVLITVTY